MTLLKTLLSALLCFFSFLLSAQVCTGGFVLANQAAVNAWGPCSSVVGSIQIGPTSGTSDITDLSPLSSLLSLSGSLIIRNNPSLTSLEGLDNITSIGGIFKLVNNNSLSDIDGLNALVHIGGNLDIQLTSLTSISGINNLDKVSGDLIIEQNELLTSITGLSSLDSVIGWFKIGGPLLIDASGFSNLKHVHGTFRISQSPLQDMTGFSSLHTVDAYFQIIQSLSTTEGLSSLETVGGPFFFQSTGISNFSGCSALSSVGGIYFIYNTALTSCSGLTNLTDIHSGFQVYSNSALTSFDGLENVNNLACVVIDIYNNVSLGNIDGLSGVTTLASGFNTCFLYINNNPSLSNLDGFLNATVFPENIEVQLTFNDILENVDGLASFDHITNLRLYDNYFLIDCDGICPSIFNGLEEFGTTISNNPPPCATFSQIEALCLPLPLELLQFEAFATDNTVEMSWEVANENRVFGYVIQRSRDGQNWDSLSMVPWNSNYRFSDGRPYSGRSYYRLKVWNEDGTDDFSVIRRIDRSFSSDDYEVYPNPVAEILYLHWTGKETDEIGTYTLRDSRAAIVREGVATRVIPLQDIPAGYYYLEIERDGVLYRKRVVKTTP